MSLVQRLTGASSSSSSAAATASGPPFNVNTVGEALSPAARLATIEKGAYKLDGDQMQRRNGEDVLDQLGIDGGVATMSRHSSFPGILSPVPASLPSISPNFFSPSMETNSLSFFHELSPAFHGNKNFLENTFLTSPYNNFLTTPVVPSPGAYWDLFNQYQEF